MEVHMTTRIVASSLFLAVMLLLPSSMASGDIWRCLSGGQNEGQHERVADAANADGHDERRNQVTALSFA